VHYATHYYFEIHKYPTKIKSAWWRRGPSGITAQFCLAGYRWATRGNHGHGVPRDLHHTSYSARCAVYTPGAIGRSLVRTCAKVPLPLTSQRRLRNRRRYTHMTVVFTAVDFEWFRVPVMDTSLQQSGSWQCLYLSPSISFILI
jgi:hypothetical protein